MRRKDVGTLEKNMREATSMMEEVSSFFEKLGFDIFNNDMPSQALKQKGENDISVFVSTGKKKIYAIDRGVSGDSKNRTGNDALCLRVVNQEKKEEILFALLHANEADKKLLQESKEGLQTLLDNLKSKMSLRIDLSVVENKDETLREELLNPMKELISRWEAD